MHFSSHCFRLTTNTHNHHQMLDYTVYHQRQMDLANNCPNTSPSPPRKCVVCRETLLLFIFLIQGSPEQGRTRACAAGRSAYAPPRFLCSPKQPWHAAVCLESLGGRKARHFSNDCRAWRNESLFPENMSSSPSFAKRYQVNQGPKELIL